MPRTIELNCYVATADGTVCCVATLINGVAELWPAKGGDPLHLPIAELRRVPNPRLQKPPIEGMPTPRPRCPWCDRQLSPDVNEERTTWAAPVTRRTFIRWKAYNGLFDRLDCARQFAVASYHAGYRRRSSQRS